MKEFRLSTTSERIVSTLFSVAMIVCFGFLLYALRDKTGLLIMCGLGTLLITVMLVLYVVNVLKAVCIVDPEKKTVEVKSSVSYTVDITGAVLLQTLPKTMGNVTMRSLVFSDEEMNIVASIPTMFTYKQGMMAEPMAEEMAKELGIEFKRNIPEWEFDKKLYQEHQKQVAQEEREAAKKRRQERKERRIRKYKNNMKK